VAPGIPQKANRPPSGTLPEWGFTWYKNLGYGDNTSINPFFYGTFLGPTNKAEPGKWYCMGVEEMLQVLLNVLVGTRCVEA
jgi:hypothetical protein